MNIQVCARTQNLLGEAPVWIEREAALRWVDIDGKRFYRYDPESAAISYNEYEEEISCVAPLEGGGFVCTFASGFALLDANAHFDRWLARPEMRLPNTRFNDGGVDPAGRFYCGTMSLGSKEPSGSLYRLENDGSATAVISDVSTCNSLAWSPDGETMYFCDTDERKIRAYAYDVQSGMIRGQKEFVAADAAPGKPDGSTTDQEGYLWNARWRGWSIARFAPDGTLDRKLDLPVKCPTCCAFGGDDMRTLYITTATIALTEEELASQPLAGALLSIRLDVPGTKRPVAKYGSLVE